MSRKVSRALWVGAWFIASLAAADEDRPRVVVIGFDGADHGLVERYMAQGHLPNLAALREEGSFTPLLPTNPPQTPVSWSTFATGTNPGKTEIFDFLKRDPDTYLPSFAMIEESRGGFMFGDDNGWALGALVGLLVALVGLGATLFLKVGPWARLLIAVLLGVAAGLPAGFVAKNFLPQEVPQAINNRQGATFWQLAGDAGLEARVIRVPNTFPAQPVENGHAVSGLGVPDMRGRIGTPSYYTSDPTFSAGENQFSVELVRLPARRGKIDTRLIGPYNKPFYDFVVDRRGAAVAPEEREETRRRVRRELDDRGIDRRIDLPLTLEATDATLTLTLSGETRTLRVGEWSEWWVLDFPVNWLVDRVAPLRGMVRFKLLALEPELELYVSPIHFHPDCHPVAFSWPPDHSEELADRFGLYKTMGWAIDTWSLPSGVGDEDLFLEDMNFTVDKFEEMMEGLLPEGDDLFVQIFYFTDRIGHMLWRLVDEGHPLYDPALAARYGGELLAAYKRMDEIVGKARRLAGEDAIFIVLSDHGFSSFRRGVNYNRWLVENGFQTLEGQGETMDLEKLFDTRQGLGGNIDWSRTKAYSLGLGAIYINLMNREGQGTVLPGEEYEQVVREIKKGLEALVDPLTGERPVARVWTRDEIYSGYDKRLIPDLRVSNNEHYRISWQDSLGGTPPDVIEDNTKAWSGDHCSLDPQQVRGILFINRKINTDAPEMLDVMPTIMKLLGLEIPEEVDGRPLL